MKFIESLKVTFKEMNRSIQRFPLTVLFMLAVMVLNALMIENTILDFTRLLFTFLIGASLSLVGQMIYERFYMVKQTVTIRYGILAASIALTIAYFFMIGPQVEFNLAISTKSIVTLFALMVAFIWVPSIDNAAIAFHQSFLSTFKAFFVTALYSSVLALGVSAIYSATDYLLVDLNSTLLSHLLNIILCLFAPLYFLSQTPEFPTENIQVSDTMKQHLRVPRFFEVLLSYIVIPLVTVYTLILVAYILLNIGTEFWSDNLLEPLMVSYAVIGMIVLILSFNIDNRWTILFRQIFPKVLIPMAIFQTVASIIKINEMGLTHGRYYVILFGVFATIVGLIYSFMKLKFHGSIALVLLILSLLSIMPPIDAFTVSKHSQLKLFEQKLKENNLLVENELRPNQDVPIGERIIITNVASYVYNMGYQNELAFLPEDFNLYTDFNPTFGFNLTYSQTDIQQLEGQYFYLNREELVFELGEADTMIIQMLNYTENQPVDETLDDLIFSVNNENYQLERILDGQYYTLTVRNEFGEPLIESSLEELFDEVLGELSILEYSEDKFLSVEDATFTVENEQVSLELLVLSLQRTDTFNSIEMMVLINIK